MRRRQCLRWALGCAGGAGVKAVGTAAGGGGAAAATARARSAVQSGLVWRERALLGFGTTLSLQAAHADAAVANTALDAAVQALRHTESVMSLFDPDSQLRRLNRDGHLVDPDPALVQVLRLAQLVAERSGGAFDITVQPLWALWQQAARAGGVPSAAELAAVRAKVDWRALDVSARAIHFRRPGMALTLNGVAQGFAADRARAALQARGIQHALIDAGEWSPLGRAPDDADWRLGLADPHESGRMLAALIADGRALACSDDAHEVFTADRRQHHILNPRSGQSPTQLSAVVVAAPSAALADALTKVMFMGSAAQALNAARRWQVGVVTVDKRGRVTASADIRLG